MTVSPLQNVPPEEANTFPGGTQTARVPREPEHRGVIIKTPDATPGLIVADGQQYSFVLPKVWQGTAAPARNQKVVFTLAQNGDVNAVRLLGRDVLAHETLSALGQTLRSNGGTFGEKALPLLQAQKDRMTMPGVVLSSALLLGFFVLPGWSLEAGNTILGVNLAYTVSQLMGVDTSGADLAVHFGFWRLIGCLVVVLPWIAPWLTFKRAQMLNVLPLVFLIALPLVVHTKLRHFAADAVKSTGQLFGGLGGDGAMQRDMQVMVEKQVSALIHATSWNSGYWVALLAAFGIAGLALKSRQGGIRH